MTGTIRQAQPGTVAALVSELQKMPADAVVIFSIDPTGGIEALWNGVVSAEVSSTGQKIVVLRA